MPKSEDEFIRLLETLGIKYIHHPKPFKLKDTTYQTDFYLPEFDVYVEVVMTNFEADKVKEVEEAYHKLILIVDPQGRPFDKKKKYSNNPEWQIIKIRRTTYEMVRRYRDQRGDRVQMQWLIGYLIELALKVKHIPQEGD